MLIVADDLGWGDVGANGQTRILTPEIDGLARSGTRLTQAWSGAPVCAPSRCVLITGRHLGNSPIRDNIEVQPEGQAPLPAGTPNLFFAAKTKGYKTACIGKWGLGPPGSSGDPLAIGVDRFFGFNCQRHAHNYFPEWLYDDRAKRQLGGFAYAPQLMLDESVKFIEVNRERPWLLAFTSPLPHLALQVPSTTLERYRGAFPETPYDGKRGYRPHPTPRAAYAAMVSYLDDSVGTLLRALDRTGQACNTLVIFTSDNGATYTGGADTTYFNSTGGLRGFKGSAYEGGLRVPLIMRWPGRIAAGATSDIPTASYDLWPTIAAATGIPAPPQPDGQSLLAQLRDSTAVAPDRPIFVDFAGYGGWIAVREGRWKIVRNGTNKRPDGPFELFDLETDPSERSNAAALHPEIVERLAKFAAKECARAKTAAAH